MEDTVGKTAFCYFNSIRTGSGHFFNAACDSGNYAR
jgi:hypothetical protein